MRFADQNIRDIPPQSLVLDKAIAENIVLILSLIPTERSMR